MNPTIGGSYVKKEDGTLERVAFTADRPCTCSSESETVSDEVAVGVPSFLRVKKTKKEPSTTVTE